MIARARYIVTEIGTADVLSKISSRSVIYTFTDYPREVEIVPSPPVGGYFAPVNKIGILAPYLALVGLICVASAIFVMKKRSLNPFFYILKRHSIS